MKSVFNRIKELLSNTELKKIDIYAAASSFGFIISVIPFLLILLMLVPYTPLTEEGLLAVANTIVPNGVNEFTRNLIESLYDGSKLLPVTVIVMLWSSSWMMIYIRHALNDIFGCKEKQNYVYLRIFGTLFLVAAAAVIVLTSAVGLAGGYIREFLIAKKLISSGFVSFILKYRFILVIGIQTLIFVFMYCLVPTEKNSFIRQLPGAFFTSIANYLYLLIFNILMDSYLDFSMYGSLAAIIIIMFYFYFIFYFFYLGALINRKISSL